MTKTANRMAAGLFLLLVQTASTAQELGYFIDQAEVHNPQLEALRLKYDIAGEKQVEAGALPDTQFDVGYFIPEMQTRTGAQRVRLSVRQMIPVFGQITAREAYASSMAETDYLDWVIGRRQLRLQVAQAYFELQAMHQQIGILQTQGTLLEAYREVALTSVGTGRASAVDVLRIDIRKSDVEAQWQMVETKFKAASFAFFKLLNTSEAAIDFEVTQLPDSLPEPDFPALGPLPELEKYGRLYESVVKEEALNRKSATPSFMVGLDYILMSRLTDVEIMDNGMDMWMPMVSLSVPIFNGAYRSRTRQNEMRQATLKAEETARRNELESLLAGAWQGQVSERIRYVAQTGNSARTRQAIDLLLKQYETEQVDFSKLLEMQEMDLKLQLERTEALKGYLSQGALVNYLTAE